MPGYRVRETQHAIGGHVQRLRVFDDAQPFADRDGHGARIGISSAQWSRFMQNWPAGLPLARATQRFMESKRILGPDCGFASRFLQRRGADMVASDVHPLAGMFPAYAGLNALPALHCRGRVPHHRHGLCA